MVQGAFARSGCRAVGGRQGRHAGFLERGDVDAGDETGDRCQGVGFRRHLVGGCEGVGRHVARRCGLGARLLGVEGGEDVAGDGLVLRVRGVEKGETGRLQERRGGVFRSVAPVRRRFREGGFDLGFAALGGVEGDLKGDESRRVQDVLVRRGLGFREAFKEGVEDGDC